MLKKKTEYLMDRYRGHEKKHCTNKIALQIIRNLRQEYNAIIFTATGFHAIFILLIKSFAFYS